MQMTHVKLLNVVCSSSGFCWAFMVSARCFSSVSLMAVFSSRRSISSMLAGSGLADEPSFRFTRFVEGPETGDLRFERVDVGIVEGLSLVKPT